MKKLSIVTVVLAIAGLACSSIVPQAVRGSGNLTTKTFEVGGFSAVELNTIGRVEFVQGEVASLEVEADDNIMPYVDVRVANGTLQLSDKANALLLPSDTIIFRVTAKNVNALTVSSSGAISSESVAADNLTLALNGSGEISLAKASGRQCTITSDGSGRITVGTLECDRVGLDMSASGVVNLSGETPLLTLVGSGSGDAALGDLKATDVRAHLSASGSATVWAVEALDAKVEGSGSLSYYGQPKVTSSMTGSGSLNSLGTH
ncbi:MAG TPA: head GIN domain-containing protein [Anaerolineales bacterium]|nr:head GIN domain-containing protein [Anaerolineales bacterium]